MAIMIKRGPHMRRARDIFKDRSGGQAIEYGMIAALIVVGILIALNSMGGSTKAMYENLNTEWENAAKG